MKKHHVLIHKGKTYSDYPEKEEIKGMLDEDKIRFILLPANQEEDNSISVSHNLGVPRVDLRTTLQDNEGYEQRTIMVKHIEVDGVCNETVFEINGPLPEEGFIGTIKVI